MCPARAAVPDWRPTAAPEALLARAALLRDIRQFFFERGVLEIETPLLCSAGVTDPALEPVVAATAITSAPSSKKGGVRYLQTSPEYAMKRLLAAGSGDIYQLCKAFRAGEVGRKHNPEYTILEWYRLGIDHHALIREVAELVVTVLNRPGWEVWPWGRLFQDVLNIDAHVASEAELAVLAEQHVGPLPDGLDRDSLLDLLMSHCIEPGIADRGVVFVVDYPASQASLARKLTVNGIEVGARFECYVDGIELANGYWECADATEMRARFEQDNEIRERRGLVPKLIDERLLAAMAAGLPDCAGVALGVDRLLMLKLGVSSLSDVLAFDWAGS